MALLVAAEVVESELRSYLEAHHIEENWGIQERILVGITPRSDARPILESGRRNADCFHGELFVTYVRQPEISPQDQTALDKNLEIAREVGATIHVSMAVTPFGRSFSLPGEMALHRSSSGTARDKVGGIDCAAIPWNV